MTYDAHIQEQSIAIYDMLDFPNTKKWQKNKNRQVSFFVKYIYFSYFSHGGSPTKTVHAQNSTNGHVPETM